MKAALPHVDVFAPAHDLASIERLAAHLKLLTVVRLSLGSTPCGLCQPQGDVRHHLLPIVFCALNVDT